ncbi:carbohydrate porin [Sphingomonas sp. LHG3406-1]|uniref:carbohydrate porin n=1 Tax=Sphingomonas sp. LHG3406-1 TaxID=2804617 RepID=UPI002638071B|nr:carbohydrate porin [Sphingomonas sp. LHG3406-1]
MARLAMLAAALLPFGSAAVAQTLPDHGRQEQAIDWGASYKLDLSFGRDGSRRVQRLDNLDLTAGASLEPLGWSGVRAYVHLLGNSGARPNDRAGTLQGINNIEVPKPGLRLFEAWIEQEFGRGSLRAGAYNLNGEFYVTDSSGLLLAPVFGIGSELAATGARGPAIFPYSALAVRGDVKLSRDGIVRAALVNASAGTLFDKGGIDVDFGDGLLGIAEGGIEGSSGKLLVGAWAYSRRQEEHNPAGVGRHRAQGIYLLAEKPLADGLTAFGRAGLSDGRTSAFRGGWQIGFQREPAPFGSPGSAFAIGIHQAWLSNGEQKTIALAGDRPSRTEAGAEITLRERLLGPISIQPSVQWIRNAGGIANTRGLLVGTLRLSIEL